MTFNPLQIALLPLFKQAQEEDALFALEVEQKGAREEKKKTFDECCDYVLGEAYKYAKEHQDGNVGLAFADEAMVIGMMKHYYDEDDIKITPVGGAKVEVKATAKNSKKAEKETEPEVAIKVSSVKTMAKVKKAEPKAEKEEDGGLFEQGSLFS